jgi:hypothetical protein
MAWSQYIDAGAGRDVRELHVRSAGELWYQVYNYVRTYSWNGATSTQVHNTNPIRAYQNFGGTVYHMYQFGSPWQFYVYRYDGTPMNWTLVDGPNQDSASSYKPWQIQAHGSDLVAIYGRYDGPNYIRRSPDGTTWSLDNPGIAETEIYALGGWVHTNGYMYCRVEEGSNSYIYRRASAGSWSKVSSLNLSSPLRSHTSQCKGDLWPEIFLELTTTGEIQYTTDFGDTWVGTGIITSGQYGIYSQAIGTTPYTFLTENGNIYEWNRLTRTFDLLDSNPAGADYCYGLAIWGTHLYATVNNQYVYEHDSWILSTNDATVGGPSPTAMDVSPDDYYLHVAVLNGSGNPVLLRLLADLSADPVKVYEPGAGSAIGVRCGDLVEERVWIAGEFGGTLKVRLSLDDGTTWTTKDPGTWSGTALPLVVGPDEDDLVLVPTTGDDDLFQTWDGGLNWDTLNNALPYDIGAMARLYWYLDEILIGTSIAGVSRAHYSVNEGATFHDVTAGLPNVAIKDLVIG